QPARQQLDDARAGAPEVPRQYRVPGTRHQRHQPGMRATLKALQRFAIFLFLCVVALQASAQVVVSPTSAQVFSPGKVWVASVQADGKVLIGGEFEFVNGFPRKNIARLNADGSVDASWNPGADGTVYALVSDASGNVYAGGYFYNVSGQPRSAIAKISASGALDPDWHPDLGITIVF